MKVASRFDLDASSQKLFHGTYVGAAICWGLPFEDEPTDTRAAEEAAPHGEKRANLTSLRAQGALGRRDGAVRFQI